MGQSRPQTPSNRAHKDQHRPTSQGSTSGLTVDAFDPVDGKEGMWFLGRVDDRTKALELWKRCDPEQGTPAAIAMDSSRVKGSTKANPHQYPASKGSPTRNSGMSDPCKAQRIPNFWTRCIDGRLGRLFGRRQGGDSQSLTTIHVAEAIASALPRDPLDSTKKREAVAGKPQSHRAESSTGLPDGYKNRDGNRKQPLGPGQMPLRIYDDSGVATNIEAALALTSSPLRAPKRLNERRFLHHAVAR